MRAIVFLPIATSTVNSDGTRPVVHYEKTNLLFGPALSTIIQRSNELPNMQGTNEDC